MGSKGLPKAVGTLTCELSTVAGLSLDTAQALPQTLLKAVGLVASSGVCTDTLLGDTLATGSAPWVIGFLEKSVCLCVVWGNLQASEFRPLDGNGLFPIALNTYIALCCSWTLCSLGEEVAQH